MSKESEKMINIEGDKNSVVITVLNETEDGGYTGLSASITTQELLDMLIDEGILEEGEAV